VSGPTSQTARSKVGGRRIARRPVGVRRPREWSDGPTRTAFHARLAVFRHRWPAPRDRSSVRASRSAVRESAGLVRRVTDRDRGDDGTVARAESSVGRANAMAVTRPQRGSTSVRAGTPGDVVGTGVPGEWACRSSRRSADRAERLVGPNPRVARSTDRADRQRRWPAQSPQR